MDKMAGGISVICPCCTHLEDRNGSRRSATSRPTLPSFALLRAFAVRGFRPRNLARIFHQATPRLWGMSDEQWVMRNEEWEIALHPSPITHRPICLAQSSAIIPRPDEISGLADPKASPRGRQSYRTPPIEKRAAGAARLDPPNEVTGRTVPGQAVPGYVRCARHPARRPQHPMPPIWLGQPGTWRPAS